MNLLPNGIEAMKETGGVVTVKSELAEDGQFGISVSDVGLRGYADALAGHSILRLFSPCAVRKHGRRAEPFTATSPAVNVSLPQPRSHLDCGRTQSMKGVRMSAVAYLIFISTLCFYPTKVHPYSNVIRRSLRHGRRWGVQDDHHSNPCLMEICNIRLDDALLSSGLKPSELESTGSQEGIWLHVSGVNTTHPSIFMADSVYELSDTRARRKIFKTPCEARLGRFHSE